MSKEDNSKESKILADVAVQGMQERKAHDIVLMDMQGLHHTVSDYFVVCHGNSTVQVAAIAQSIEEEVFKTLKQEPWRKEGLGNNEWILLDFIDVVVHVFHRDKRYFYGIEELWADAEVHTFKSA
ncbi:MAG TPA: ribosome silencing factor [Sphingobacterium sp.]|nr:ribosome silencing factor [Sphingobacterium sp.]